MWKSIFSLSACILLLGSCNTLDFYGQAIAGQWEISRKSRPSQPIIDDPGTDGKLRGQLRSVEEIRRFASSHLSLPGGESYGRYADLGREYVVWVLYATPEFSLEPKKWKYPTLGELDYRGYFQKEDTAALADDLRARGDDVYTGGVTAYSTLGWFHDPVLNTFVNSADVDLAELIFHELTHRRLFRRGDTTFNESLANAMAEEGVRRWLKHGGRDVELRRYEERLVRRGLFYDEIDSTREKLAALYRSGSPPKVMRTRKAMILKDLRGNFRELRRRWGGRGLEAWLVEDLNNAHLVSVMTYHHHVPAFHRLLAECEGDLELFFVKAKDLGLPEPAAKGLLAKEAGAP